MYVWQQHYFNDDASARKLSSLGFLFLPVWSDCIVFGMQLHLINNWNFLMADFGLSPDSCHIKMH